MIAKTKTLQIRYKLKILRRIEKLYQYIYTTPAGSIFTNVHLLYLIYACHVIMFTIYNK